MWKAPEKSAQEEV
eukprot:IDg19599t1